MRGRLRLFLWIGAAVIGGLICSEVIIRSTITQRAIGRIFHRSDLVAAANLKNRSKNELVDEGRVENEAALIQFQFANASVFIRTLERNHFSREELRGAIRDRLRETDWIEKQISRPAASTIEAAAHEFYQAHPTLFHLPERLRAAHLFLAAHAETPTDVVEAKRKAIDELSGRIARGESFAELVSEFSEDEATKKRGGDLGFFSSERMPEDFLVKVATLKVGEISKPIQTHLGFHLVQVTERKPARALSFAEARGEIGVALANLRRRECLARVANNLSELRDCTSAHFP